MVLVLELGAGRLEGRLWNSAAMSARSGFGYVVRAACLSPLAPLGGLSGGGPRVGFPWVLGSGLVPPVGDARPRASQIQP